MRPFQGPAVSRGPQRSAAAKSSSSSPTVSGTSRRGRCPPRRPRGFDPRLRHRPVLARTRAPSGYRRCRRPSAQGRRGPPDAGARSARRSTRCCGAGWPDLCDQLVGDVHRADGGGAQPLAEHASERSGHSSGPNCGARGAPRKSRCSRSASGLGARSSSGGPTKARATNSSLTRWATRRTPPRARSTVTSSGRSSRRGSTYSTACSRSQRGRITPAMAPDLATKRARRISAGPSFCWWSILGSNQ
jgi:hypothetical protein